MHKEGAIDDKLSCKKWFFMGGKHELPKDPMIPKALLENVKKTWYMWWNQNQNQQGR